jgi:signal transduction histidine kinase
VIVGLPWCGGADFERSWRPNRGADAVLEGSNSTMTRRWWPAWAPTLSPMLVDGVLAAGLGLLSLSSSFGDARRAGTRLGTLTVLLLVALVPALWVRRRLPGTTLVAVAAIQAGLLALRVQPSANFLAEMVAPYSVALYGSRRVRLATSVGAGVALVVAALPTGLPSYQRSNAIALLLAGIGAWMLGATLRGRRAHVAELEDRTARLERERELEASRAVAEERLRIARELHDVVAHNLSVVVVVQAQAVQRTIDRDVDRARAVVESIERTGREALDEMRQLLGVLRDGAGLEPDGEEAGSYGPQPGLERLEELVAQVRSAGVPAELRLEGTPRPLGPAMELSAYRIVQEALTNVLKHAGAAHAEVLVRYGEREVELTVSDDGRGAAAALAAEHGAPGSGHGLVGMRERAALFDGELTSGPRPGGGYQVRARLPLEVREP